MRITKPIVSNCSVSRLNPGGIISRIGGWWDRKGENEIDLVCEDELTGQVDIYEVKADRARFDAATLQKKIDAFLEKNPTLKGRIKRTDVLSLKNL